MKVRSVLTLTCVAWVCAAAAEQRLSKTQQECWYPSPLAALEIPFPLFPLPWTGWLILGTPVSRAGGPPVNTSCISLAQGSDQGLSLHRDTPNQAVNVLLPLCALGAGPNACQTGLGPLGSTSPPRAHGNVVTINLAFHF